MTPDAYPTRAAYLAALHADGDFWTVSEYIPPYVGGTVARSFTLPSRVLWQRVQVAGTVYGFRSARFVRL